MTYQSKMQETFREEAKKGEKTLINRTVCPERMR